MARRPIPTLPEPFADLGVPQQGRQKGNGFIISAFPPIKHTGNFCEEGT
jgi:hypothetical protein